jgi:hypothetical protein
MRHKKNSEVVIMEGAREYAKLYSYASGDGSLSFNWAETAHPMKSINKSVTRDQVERYVKQKENAHLLNGHTIFEAYGQIHLIPIARRVSLEQIDLRGEVYDVRAAWYADSEGKKRLNRSGTEIKFTYPESHPLGAETFEVKNVSIRAAICYFLEHEKIYSKLNFKHRTRGEYMTVNNCVIRYNPYWKEFATTCKLTGYPGEVFKVKADAIHHCKNWK